MPMDVTIGTLMTAVEAVFAPVLAMVSDLAETIVSTPLFIVPLALLLVGFAIGVMARIISSVRG